MILSITLGVQKIFFAFESGNVFQIPYNYGQLFRIYRVFIKYCVFSLIFFIFLNSASSAAAPVFYLPDVCTHWHRGTTEKDQSPEFFKIFGEKNTIFNEHPVVEYSDSEVNWLSVGWSVRHNFLKFHFQRFYRSTLFH